MSSASDSPFVRFLGATLRQPMVVAFAVAGAIAVILALAVIAVWTEGPPPRPAPPTVLAAAVESTPVVVNAATGGSPVAATATPRPVAPRRPTATPRPQVAVATVPVIPPTPTATPLPQPTATPTVVPTATPAALYEAAGADALATMAGGSWFMNEGQLTNEGVTVYAEPWIVAPTRPPSGAYAVEAELRVKNLVEGVCNQSFGVVAGGATGVVWGGGVLYGCDGDQRARLTDVTNWSDGYDRDRPLAAKKYEPPSGWHTFRLEVRGNELRLLIDGEQVLEATDDQAGAQPATDGAQVGVWSQGVRLAVRRVAVYSL